MEIVEIFNIMSNSIYDRNFDYLIRKLFLLFIVIAALIYLRKKNDIKYRKYFIFITVTSIVIIASSLFLSLFTFFSTVSEYRSIYKNGSYNTVEGIVSDFKPMPLRGDESARESFNVNGITFNISNHSETAAYSKRRIDGSPIKNGVYLKLYYFDKKISDNNIIGLWVTQNKY